jgi:NADPH-dependent F420 reductase
MKIAIVGTGAMAAGFAENLVGAGHEVVVGSRDPHRAAAFAENIGSGTKSAPLAQAFALAEVVILAVPYAAVGAILDAADDLTDKVLVDISNPITADYKDLVIGHTTSAAEEIQKLAPSAKVVKGFNTLFAGMLSKKLRAGTSVQTFLAGDDASAKAKVDLLARALGLDPVDAGALSNSRFLEPIGEMNIHMGFYRGWGTSIAPAWNRLPS